MLLSSCGNKKIADEILKMQNSNATTYAEITTQNIEALTQEDDDAIHIWCCGIVRTCAKGDNYRIIGKTKQSPCK